MHCAEITLCQHRRGMHCAEITLCQYRQRRRHCAEIALCQHHRRHSRRGITKNVHFLSVSWYFIFPNDSVLHELPDCRQFIQWPSFWHFLSQHHTCSSLSCSSLFCAFPVNVCFIWSFACRCCLSFCNLFQNFIFCIMSHCFCGVVDGAGRTLNLVLNLNETLFLTSFCSITFFLNSFFPSSILFMIC